MVDEEPDEPPATLPSPLGPIPIAYTSVPPTGYRLWRIVGAHQHDLGEAIPYLCSPYRETLWDRPEAIAVCKATSARWHPARERAPALTCKCGLYATKQLPRLDLGGLVVEGMVELYGRVLEGTEGYRASKARLIGALTLVLGCVGTDARPAGAGVYPRSYCRELVQGTVMVGRQYRPLCHEHSEALLRSNREAFGVTITSIRDWLISRYQTEVNVRRRHQ